MVDIITTKFEEWVMGHEHLKADWKMAVSSLDLKKTMDLDCSTKSGRQFHI